MGCHCLVHGAKHNFWDKCKSVSFLICVIHPHSICSLSFFLYTRMRARAHTHTHTHIPHQLNLNTRGRNYSLRSASSVRTKSRILDAEQIPFPSSLNLPAMQSHQMQSPPNQGGRGRLLSSSFLCSSSWRDQSLGVFTHFPWASLTYGSSSVGCESAGLQL